MSIVVFLMKMNKNIFYEYVRTKLVFQIDSYNVNIFTFYTMSLRNFETFDRFNVENYFLTKETYFISLQ